MYKFHVQWNLFFGTPLFKGHYSIEGEGTLILGPETCV